MVAIVSFYCKTSAASFTQTLYGSTYISGISVVPATCILANISSQCSDVSYLRTRNGMSGFCKETVFLVEKRGTHYIGKTRKGAYSEIISVFPNVIKSRYSLKIDDCFGILRQNISLEHRQQITTTRVKPGPALIFAESLTGLLYTISIKVCEGPHQTPPLSFSVLLPRALSIRSGVTGYSWSHWPMAFEVAISIADGPGEVEISPTPKA